VRGLSASGGGSENNITFKSTRKRLVFETLHLDIEGGVGERRTTAPPERTWELEEGRESRGTEGESTGGKGRGGREKAARKVAFQADMYDF